jgi:hypothetical protein
VRLCLPEFILVSLSSVSHGISYWIDYLIVQKLNASVASSILIFHYKFFQFQQEEEMSNYNYDDELAFSGLFDQGAEVFTKKMFRHSQAKAQENWNDMKKDRQTKKMFTVRSRSRRASSRV